MKTCGSLACLAVLLGWSAASAQEPESPYARGGSAEVKTLSEAEVKELLEGEGMGLARAAELNGYPGPRHALDLADSLGLSAQQREDAARIRVQMTAEARALGRRIVDAEKALDAAFAAGAITEEELRAAVEEIADLQAELRLTHLRAHLATRAALTPEQIEEYDRLRGYAGGHQHPGGVP